MPAPAPKTPGPDHPIAISPNSHHITVTVAGTEIAATAAALTLREAAYPPVHYIPRADADMAQLARSDHQTYCPYKGACSYFSIPAAGAAGVNAVWSYEAPYPAVAAIAGHLAFYQNRVKLTEL